MSTPDKKRPREEARADAGVRMRHTKTGATWVALRFGRDVRVSASAEGAADEADAKRARGAAPKAPEFENEADAQAWLEQQAEELAGDGYEWDLGLVSRPAPAWRAADKPADGDELTLEVEPEISEVFDEDEKGLDARVWTEFRDVLAAAEAVSAEQLAEAEAALQHGLILRCGEERCYDVFFVAERPDGGFDVCRSQLEDGMGVPFQMCDALRASEDREQLEQLVDPARMFDGEVCEAVREAARLAVLRPSEYDPQPDDCLFEWEVEIDPATFPRDHVAIVRHDGGVCWATAASGSPAHDSGYYDRQLAAFREWYDAWAAKA